MRIGAARDGGMRDTGPSAADGVTWRRGRPGDDRVLHPLAVALAQADDPAHVPAPSDTAQLLGQVDLTEALIVGEAAGTPVAFGLRYRPGRGPVRLLGGVAPDRRGRGIGRALLGWQLRDAEGAEPDAPLSTLRSVGDQGAAGLARRFGFVPEREFLTMRRRLDRPIEPPSAVLGVRVTALPPELDEAVRQAKNAAFRDHWQSSEESAEEWVHRAVGPRLDRERSRIALVGEEVAGFVVAWLAPERPGEVYVLLVGTISRWRGRGVATMLLTEVLLAGAADGRSTAVLDVDAANSTGARRVYSHVGFQTVARATVWGLARR